MPQSRVHQALAGEIVYVIPPEYDEIYRLITKNTGMRTDNEYVFGFLENRGLIKIMASEISPVEFVEEDDEEDLE